MRPPSFYVKRNLHSGDGPSGNQTSFQSIAISRSVVLSLIDLWQDRSDGRRLCNFPFDQTVLNQPKVELTQTNRTVPVCSRTPSPSRQSYGPVSPSRPAAMSRKRHPAVLHQSTRFSPVWNPGFLATWNFFPVRNTKGRQKHDKRCIMGNRRVGHFNRFCSRNQATVCM
jgi:hypothetical protein